MIKIITGDTATFTFTILYPGAVDGVENPDLSTATVVFAMQKSGSSKIVIEKEIVHPESNIVYFSLAPEETSALTAGVYNACCKIYFDNGEAKTAWLGDVTVIKGILNA
jgi:hypothetical protein